MCGYSVGVLPLLMLQTCTGKYIYYFLDWIGCDVLFLCPGAHFVSYQVMYCVPHLQLYWLCHAFHPVRNDMLLSPLHYIRHGF